MKRHRDIIGWFLLLTGCSVPSSLLVDGAKNAARDHDDPAEFAAEADTRCACADADGDGYPGAPCEADCPDGSAELDCDDAEIATFPGAVEDLDYRDNDCDGARDEDYLLMLYRTNWTNGLVCNQGGADFDHCFTTEAVNGAACAGGLGGGADWLLDGQWITVYSPGIGRGDEATVGPMTFAALYECYDAENSEHLYVPAGHPLYGAPGFECAPDPVGYVYTSVAPDTSMRAVRYHDSPTIRDRMFSIIKNEAEECGFTDNGVIFWAFGIDPAEYLEYSDPD